MRSSRDIIVNIISDLHVGSSMAICSMEPEISDLDTVYRPNPLQKEMNECWFDCIDDLTGRADYCVLNGEPVDGANKRQLGNQSWTTNLMDQVNDSVKIVKEIPYDNIIVNRGSGYHVQQDGTNFEEVFADKIGLLIARNISINHLNSKFIVDVKSTGLFEKDEILNKNNCKTIYWKTGHSYIKRKVNEDSAIAGFEKSGHFFFNKPIGFGFDDGINSAIQICHLLNNQNHTMNELVENLPKTFQSPTMSPFCKDDEKYKVIDDLTIEINKLKENKTKIDGLFITNILTVNGVRFTLEDGSWGLIRASSNKPSLVVVTESPSSDNRKKEIFYFIDKLLKQTGKIGEYDQKI